MRTLYSRLVLTRGQRKIRCSNGLRGNGWGILPKLSEKLSRKPDPKSSLRALLKVVKGLGDALAPIGARGSDLEQLRSEQFKRVVQHPALFLGELGMLRKRSKKLVGPHGRFHGAWKLRISLHAVPLVFGQQHLVGPGNFQRFGDQPPHGVIIKRATSLTGNACVPRRRLMIGTAVV